MAFTFFFRDLQALELAVDHVVPEIAGRRRPRIWDAGCAMGPEPYTLAILLAGRLGHFGFRNLQIVASDHDESGCLKSIVRHAEYKRSDLDRMPAGVLEKYFEPASEPDVFRVSEWLRSAVRFVRHGLLSLQGIDSGFSLVVCKNVLLHFSSAQRVEVIRMFHRALAPGGYFVTEHTQKLPRKQVFGLRRSPDMDSYSENVRRSRRTDLQTGLWIKLCRTVAGQATKVMKIGPTSVAHCIGN